MPILIKGSGGAQEAPVITVSSSGLITAKAGDETATKQLPTQAAKTVWPGTYSQTAVASGKYTTGSVTVAGDSNLAPENIREGCSIFGVTGTHSSTYVYCYGQVTTEGTLTLTCEGITPSSEILHIGGYGVWDVAGLNNQCDPYIFNISGQRIVFVSVGSSGNLREKEGQIVAGDGTITITGDYLWMESELTYEIHVVFM